jgi:hypothetical protein
MPRLDTSLDLTTAQGKNFTRQWDGHQKLDVSFSNWAPLRPFRKPSTRMQYIHFSFYLATTSFQHRRRTFRMIGKFEVMNLANGGMPLLACDSSCFVTNCVVPSALITIYSKLSSDCVFSVGMFHTVVIATPGSSGAGIDGY